MEHIHGVCQRMHDHEKSKQKEEFIPPSKEVIDKIKKSLLKIKKVRRYSPSWIDANRMDLLSDGKYVLYKDYLKLEKRISDLMKGPINRNPDYLVYDGYEKLRKERNRLSKENKRLKKIDIINNMTNYLDSVCKYAETELAKLQKKSKKDKK